MPRFKVTTPDGKTAIVEGDAPPTDEDLDYLFSTEGMVDRAADRAAEGAQRRTQVLPGEESAVAGAMRRSHPTPDMPEYYKGTGLSDTEAAIEAGKFAGDVRAAPIAGAVMTAPLWVPMTKAALLGTATGLTASYGAETLAEKAGLPKGVSRALGIGAGVVGGVAGMFKPGRAMVRNALESAVGFVPRMMGRGFVRGATEAAKEAGIDTAHTAALREMAKRELGIETAQAAALREAAAREAALSGAQGAAAREAAAREAGVTAAHGGALRETAARESGMSAAHGGAAREAAMRESTIHSAHGAAAREAARREATSPLAAIAARRRAAQAVVTPPAAAPAAAPSAAVPATDRAAAAAKLEALLSQALREGQGAAATREAAKGNRQLAEELLRKAGL